MHLGWRVVLVGTAAVALAFLVPGTEQRLDARFAALSPRLDGLDYLRTGPEFSDFEGNDLQLADDLPLISWLREHVEGSPTIVEGLGPFYQWNGRMSAHTGLPTVIGWEWHETQQRWGFQESVRQRVADVESFYFDHDPQAAARFLRTYDVSWVVVGTVERARGTVPALAKLERMPALVPAFRSGPYVIYRVDKSRLT